jgi:glycosyltransferase involved in cell wall biosynthesis
MSVAAARSRSIPKASRVVIAHDYLTQKGGAERVVLSMHRAFPDAPIYTSLFSPDRTFPEFEAADVRPLAINRIPALRREHRFALPFLAPAFSSLQIDADVVICSSSGWAHGLRTRGRKIVYCHTPARWLYQSNRYFGSGHRIIRSLLAAIRPLLVVWDRNAARSAHRYLTQSIAVRGRIHDLYGIEAQLVPAPFGIGGTGPARSVPGLNEGYYLCVSRLLPYKNLDQLIGAFQETPNRHLVIAGEGPERTQLSSRAPRNVTLLGSVGDEELRWLYAHCRGLIAASYEDYGLVPIEAAAFAKPTAALRWGGFLDTVKEGKTGVFFDRPVATEIAKAILRMEATVFDSECLRAHAELYSEERFITRIREVVAAEVALTK